MTAILVGALVAAASAAAARSPAFEDYPALVRAPAILAKADFKSCPSARRFRTLIRRADAEPPNFAGYLTATEVGCGTGCLFLIVVDRKTGRIQFFPSGVLSWSGDSREGIDKFGFNFRVESRLIRVCGEVGGDGHLECRYYDWTEAGPKLVGEEGGDDHQNPR
jgi:hypothetical protein